MFKKLLLVCLLFLFGNQFINAQLSSGDIAFIGMNTDATEGYAFITLADIPGSEVIFFSDRGIISSSAYILGTEGTYKFTAPAAGIPCGTIVSFAETSPDTYTISGISGATMALEAGSANLGSGDQVYAYQTTMDVISSVPSDATFIAGIMSDYDAICVDAITKWTQPACVSSTSESIVPPGLTNTENCVSMTPNGPEIDNMRYTGTLTGTSTFLRGEINDYTNWETNNSPSYGIGPSDFTSPSITCVSPCTEPDVPTATFAPGTVCDGNTALITISGDKNDATAWHIYTGSCGGTLVGTTAGSTIIVTPTPPSTQYFIRGEGGCVTPGACGSLTITTTTREDATFSYAAAAYCINDSDPTPTITGVGGGTFSAGGGLSINTSTGEIDVSASTPSTYTVTYTTPGLCAGDEDVVVTIHALDDPSFSYDAAAYCIDDSDPTPTITGLAGGTFSSGAGLSINASTGAIDVSASTPGTYTITYTTAGSCPNSSSVSVTVNAVDDASFSYDAAAYCIDDSDPTPTITGLAAGTFSSGAGLSINTSSGAIDVSASTPGTYTVTYTTTGTCPNSSSVTVTINALDDPSFFYSAAAYCANAADPTPTITGLAAGTFSSGAGLSINSGTGAIDVSASTPGTYTVTYTTAGTCPSSSSIGVTIDEINAVCQNIQIYLDFSGNALITAADIDGGSSNNCGAINLSASTTSFTCANIGANNVTLTADDGNGNMSTCIAVVAVSDTTSPVAVCQNITVFLDGTGNATITAADIDGGSSDNCGSINLSASITAFTCADLGANNVTLTVVDGNGNMSTCVAVVTVSDTTSPTAVCQNITVFLDGSGNATITAAEIDGGSNDNCGTSNLSASITAFTCADLGANNVTLTVVDGTGNMSTCVAVVTVSDTTSPTAVCQNITVFLDGSGNATITAADLDGGSSDNCGGTLNLGASITAFTCADLGANNVTLTVDDGNGNTSTCIAVVTISDTISPTAVCQNITVFLDGTGNATITAADIDGGSSDNCSSINLSASITAFTCADLGANNVTLTVVDGTGNMSTCVAVVTVSDTTSPTAVCQNITVFLDGSGNATITAADIDGGSNDNCGTPNLSASITAFTCADLGANNVTLTVVDGTGNMSTCVAVVTVSDTTSPTAVCQNITVFLDGSGNATITAADLDGGSSDNCGGTPNLGASAMRQLQLLT